MTKFTRNEWEIILHRLEVGDAIVEVLTDGNEYSANAVAMLANAIEMLMYNGCKRTWFNMVELTVLRECCEGSTWFAGMDDAVARGEMTQGQANGYTRAANRLQDRFNVTIPRA